MSWNGDYFQFPFSKIKYVSIIYRDESAFSLLAIVVIHSFCWMHIECFKLCVAANMIRISMGVYKGYRKRRDAFCYFPCISVSIPLSMRSALSVPVRRKKRTPSSSILQLLSSIFTISIATLIPRDNDTSENYCILLIFVENHQYRCVVWYHCLYENLNNLL